MIKNKETSLFLRKLSVIKQQRRLCLMLVLLLKVIGLAMLMLAFYCLGDYLFAFSTGDLLALNFICLAIPIAVFLFGLLRIFMLSNSDIVQILDQHMSSTRRDLQSTFELIHEYSQDSSEMIVFLVHKMVQKGQDILKSTKLAHYFPGKRMKHQLKIFALQLIVAAVIIGVPFQASQVILSRIFNPFADIPPYSKYVFQITPEEPSVIYGNDLELSCQLKGGPAKSQIWLYSEIDGKIHKSACFRDGENRFSQKIQSLTKPMSFCFTMGKLRSKWHSVKLLYQPKIVDVKVTVNAPAYTHLKENMVYLNNNSIQGYSGSTVTLEVFSNRPLSEGRLELKDKETSTIKTVQGRKTSTESMVFDWKLENNAHLQVTIRDIRGTATDTPLDIEQNVIVDRVPEITIDEPDTFVLATPNSVIPFNGSINDDLGLKKIDVVKTIIGYRDRDQFLGPEFVCRQYEFDAKLGLNELGVQPGQIIEMYVEASDCNPSLMGNSSSEIVRIKVISEKEYAEFLRSRSDFQEMVDRYNQLAYKFNELKKVIDKMKKALADGKLSEAQKKELVQELQNANQQIKDFLTKLNQDFPIYDMEKEQKEMIKKLLEKIIKNEMLIDDMKQGGDWSKKLSEMENNLKGQDQQISQVQKQVQQMNDVYDIMKLAADYSRMLKEQNEIVQRLTRYMHERSSDSAMLRRLAEREKKLKEQLEKLRDTLNEKAEKLPSEQFYELKKDALNFAKRINVLGIPDLLHKAFDNASHKNGGMAHHYAKLAFERMKQLGSKDQSGQGQGQGQGECPFRDFINCQMPSGLGQKMGMTAQQLLNSIFGNMKKGFGGMSAGGGGIGDPNDGYSSSGQSPLNVPVHGPARQSFHQRLKSSGTGRGQGSGKGQGASNRIGKDANESLDIKHRTKTETESISVDEVPDKYRNAVKQYFSDK